VEGKGGKSGYWPAGVMDCHAIQAVKPEDRKKVGRKTRILLPLRDEVIKNHLTGKQAVAIYPLLPETCWFLAADAPISWKGTLQQYVGRLHRLHENKTEVQVYDYADVSVPMLVRMYEKEAGRFTSKRSGAFYTLHTEYQRMRRIRPAADWTGTIQRQLLRSFFAGRL